MKDDSETLAKKIVNAPQAQARLGRVAALLIFVVTVSLLAFAAIMVALAVKALRWMLE